MIKARVASRRSWAEDDGIPMDCAMWCVSMHWKRCAMKAQFLSSTKQAL